MTLCHPNVINVEIQVKIKMEHKQQKQDNSRNRQSWQVKQIILGQVMLTLSPITEIPRSHNFKIAKYRLANSHKNQFSEHDKYKELAKSLAGTIFKCPNN